MFPPSTPINPIDPSSASSMPIKLLPPQEAVALEIILHSPPKIVLNVAEEEFN